MEITDEMLFGAIRKAVETGLLPRAALKEPSREEMEQLRLVLKAAIDAVPTGCENPLCLPLGGAAKVGCMEGAPPRQQTDAAGPLSVWMAVGADAIGCAAPCSPVKERAELQAFKAR